MKKYILIILFIALCLPGLSLAQCDPPRDLEASVAGNDVHLIWSPPQESTMMSFKEIPRQGVSLSMDTSPRYREIFNPISNRGFLDLQFSYPCYFADGEAGVESDGNFIYSSKWQDTRFACYQLDGSLVDSFNINNVDQVRDMAFCETDGLMYGAQPMGDSGHLYVMDFNTRTLVDDIILDRPIRSLAYDPDLDVFYGNNWSSDVSVIDRQTGAITATIPLSGSYGEFYGFAYDNWSENGPYVWGFSQSGTMAEIVQMKLPGFTETGLTVDVSYLVSPDVAFAGGLFTQPDIVQGTVTLGGLIQNEVIFGLELADISPPPLPVLAGYNLFRNGTQINSALINDTAWTDTDLNPGSYSYAVTAVYEDAAGTFICESDPSEPATAIIQAPLVLGGNIFAGIYKLDVGEALAYSVSEGNVELAYDTEVDDFGYYYFLQCAPGDYYLFTRPSGNSSFTGTIIPTYYGDVYHWEDATVISLNSNLYNQDVHMIPIIPSGNGPGRISGNVFLENKNTEATPANGIQMLLLNSQDECKGLDYTDSQGYFVFDQLPTGTYKLVCEVTGKKMAAQIFYISNENLYDDGLSLIIADDEIVMGINETLPPEISYISELYPNPAQDYSSLEIGLAEDQLLSFSIISLTGNVISSYYHNVAKGSGKVAINTADLKPGIYIVKIMTGNKLILTRKLVISR